MFSHPNRLWNVDETEISSAQGKFRKVFSSSTSHHGGSVIQNSTGQSMDVTAVVTISAGGLIAPPVIIVEGKNIMKSWFKLLSVADLNHEPELMWLTHEQ